MRYCLTALSLLFLASELPSARAQQSGPPSGAPTSQEIGFADNQFSVPVSPFATIAVTNGLPTFSTGASTFPGLSSQIAVDSREVVHAIGVFVDTAPDGIHPRQTLVYKNTVPDARRANGFSDPVILKQVVLRTPQETSQPGDSNGFLVTDIIVDKDDTVHVVWIEGIATAPLPTLYYGFGYPAPYARTVFHASRVQGIWTRPAQLSPTGCPGFGTNPFPSSVFQSTLIWTDYGLGYNGFGAVFADFRLKLGADGRPYLAIPATANFGFFVPRNEAEDVGPTYANTTQACWLLADMNGSWQPVQEMTNLKSIELSGLVTGQIPTFLLPWTGNILIDFAVNPGGAPTFLWTQVVGTQTPQGQIVPPYSRINYYTNGFSGKTPYDIPFPGGLSTFMTYDSQGTLHQWDGSSYRDGIGGSVQTVQLPQGTIPWQDLFVDGQDQLHFLSTSGGFAPSTLMIYSRLKDPQTRQLSPTFVRSGMIAFNPNRAGPTTNQGSGHFIALSKNGRVHLGGLNYTCSGQSVLGVRDPGAMAAVLPGAQANVTSGNLFGQISLFSTSGVAPAQALGLAYNSLEPGEGLAGASWRMSAESYLVDGQLAWNQDGDRVTLVQPDGRRVTFHYNADWNALLADPDQSLFARIERQNPSNPEYKLVTKTGEVLWFNTSGRLRQVVDPTGNIMDFVHDDSIVNIGAPGVLHVSHLIQINDMNGRRSTSLRYEGSNPQFGSRVTQINDPGGSVYNLSYQGRSLSSVSFSSAPDSPTYDFEYYAQDDPSTGAKGGLLSRFRTPRAHAGNYAWTCLYHQSGRLAGVQDPQETYLLENASDTDAPTSQIASQSLRYADQATTWLTDRRGFRTRFVGDNLRSLVSEMDDEAVLAQTPGITPIVRLFDFQGNLVDLQDRWGFHTSYTFQYAGATPNYVQDNLLSIQRPSAQGSGQDLVAAYTYTSDGLNRVRTATTYATPPEGSAALPRTTTNDWNSAGQLLAVHYPDVSYPDGSTQTGVQATFEYKGPQFQLTRAVNENGHGVDYTNFDGMSGLPQNVLADGGSDPRLFQYDAMGNVLQKKEPLGGVMNDPPGWTMFRRDGLYRVSTQVDPKGMITSFTYDVDSNLVQATPPTGSPTATLFDKRGIASGGVTPDGVWNQWVDAAGNVKRSQDLRGFFTNRTLDFMGRVTEVRSPGASTLPAGTGGGGDAIEKTRYAYDLIDDKLVRFTTSTVKGAPADRITKTILDNRGRVSVVVAPDGMTTQQTFYNELDQAVASQSAFGNQIQQCVVTFRDTRDRSYQTRKQNGPYGGSSTQQASTYTLFDPAGNVSLSVDELGHVDQPGDAHKRKFLYDVRERLQYEIDGKGVIVREHKYGDDDRLVEVKVPDPEGKSPLLVTQAQFAYTTRKEQRSALDRNGKGMTYAYGSLPGQLRTATDAMGQVAQTDYDPGTVRVSQVTEALGTASENRMLYAWTNGLLTKTQVWNPASQAYNATFERFYDQAGRLEKTQGPAVSPEQYSYNAFSEMTQTVAGSKTLAVQYNMLGQAFQKTWSGAYSARQNLGYDGAGHLKSIDDGNLARAMSFETWKGAPLDEVFSVGGSIWKLQSHQVDNAGNHVGFSDAEAKTHEWPVDENNRPTKKRFNNQDIALLSYTPGGLVDKEVLQNASGQAIATTNHTYDGLGRPSASQTVDPSGAVLAEYGWDYNDRHDVVAIHVQHLNAHFTIGVDERGRVASASTPGNQNGLAPPPPYTNDIGGQATGLESSPSQEISVTPKAMLAVPPRSASYTYAPGGNRMSQTVDGVTTTYAYNAANQLTTETGPNRSVQHQYDEWGNETNRTTTKLVQMPDGSTSTQTTVETYGYNHLNLLSAYSNSATGALWQYDYYPDGTRYAKTDLNANSGEVYVPRFGEVVTEYSRVASSSTVSITPKNTYVGGLGLNSKNLRIDAQGARRHLIGDRVGTVGMTLDDAGSAVEQSVTDPFGVQIAGGTSEPYGGVAQSKLDPESGLTFMRNRMYDSNLGRFTQTDPILGNRPHKHYAYASNNPISNIDPMGLDDNEVWNMLKLLFEWETWKTPFTYGASHPKETKEWVKSEVTGTLKTAVQIQTIGTLGTATAAWGGVAGFAGRNLVLGTAVAAEDTAYRWTVEGQTPTVSGFAQEAGGNAAAGMLLEGGFVVGGRVFGIAREAAQTTYDFLKNPKAYRLVPPSGLQGSLGPVPNFRLQYVGTQAGAGQATGKTFASVVTKEELAAWQELQAKYPEFMPDINSEIRILTPAEVKAARASVESGARGHHKLPLSFGGPPNPEGGLVPTGETQTVKNEGHTEVSTFFFRLLMRLRSEAGK